MEPLLKAFTHPGERRVVLRQFKAPRDRLGLAGERRAVGGPTVDPLLTVALLRQIPWGFVTVWGARDPPISGAGVRPGLTAGHQRGSGEKRDDRQPLNQSPEVEPMTPLDVDIDVHVHVYVYV